MKLTYIPLLLYATLLLFAACEREEEVALDQAEANQALNETESSVFFDELHVMTTQAVTTAEGGRMQQVVNAIPACATLLHEEDSRTSIIDFGDGCTDAAGNVRTGKIVISWSGGYFTQGASIVTTLENYTINGVQVAGTLTLTNITASNTANPQFTVNLSGGRVEWPDGAVAEREVNHVRTWMRATNPFNDAWHIDGTASGVNRIGRTYTSTISNTLVYTLSCVAEGAFIPVAGTLAISSPERSLLTVDFGDGSCDNEFVVSANGRSRTLTATR